jgi:hypothetical protein
VLNAVLTGSGLKLSDSRVGEAAAPGSSPGAESRIAEPLPDPINGTQTIGDISTVSSPPPVVTAIP